jgi:outer membrane protein assembly factor BamB
MKLTHLALLALLVCLIQSGWAGEPAPVPMGSADFRPTLERPLGFRGDGSGKFPGATPPIDWSETENVRWSTVVGRSYSSPIVVDKAVLVTSEPNLLICLNRADGREQWRLKISPELLSEPKAQTAAKEYQAKDAGMSAATPMTDGSLVYAVFANGIVCASDLAGKLKWAIYVDAPENTTYGRSASPAIINGKLIIHMGHLFAFDPATGKELWANPDAKSAYGTPVGHKAGGIGLIVTPPGDVVRCDDGKSVLKGLGPSFHTTPVIHDETIFFGDRELRSVKITAALKDEDQWNSEVVGDIFGSPVLHEGLLYTVNEKGELFAFEAKGKGTLEPVINARPLFDSEENGAPVVYASLTLAGKHLYLNSNRGEIIVMEATREATSISKNKMKDGTGSSLLFSGSDLFIRAGEKLYCIAETSKR